MNRILHPFRTYRLQKEARERASIDVEIEYPRLIIKGKRYFYTENRDGLTYVAFLGIPYACRPKRDLRFWPPKLIELPEPASSQPPAPIKIKAYASKSKNSRLPCFKYDSKRGLIRLQKKKAGSENCLYLNVYLPEKPEKISSLLPVLVYIHGGTFIKGDNGPDNIKPDHILRRNVIFVTINYRLGFFGFLDARIEKCQGNAGLKDQVEALKWIQLNIKKFKGDPNNVTISGHEAGATCVNLLMISPLSANKNLFHKAIVQAGGIYCPWGFKEKRAYKYVKAMCKIKYDTSDSSFKPHVTREALISTMKDTNAKSLMKDMNELVDIYSKRRPFKLVVFFGPAQEFRDAGAFLPKGRSIESLMKQAAKNVPVIAGFTKREGYKYFYERLDWTESQFKKMLTEETLFIKFLKENCNCSTEWARNTMDQIRQNYFEGLTANSNYQTIQDKLATFLTDLWFHRFYDNFMVDDESFAPLYVYQFNYFDRYREDGVLKCRDENEKLSKSGICKTAPGHEDDNEYLYNPGRIKLQVCRRSNGTLPSTTNITEKMSCLWASFCHHGVPKYENFEWLPHTEAVPMYLSIDESLSMVTDRLGENRWPTLRNILQSVSPDSSPDLPSINRPSVTHNPDNTSSSGSDSSIVTSMATNDSPTSSEAHLVTFDD